METNTPTRPKPQQIRRLGFAVGAALLALIWSSYFFANRSVNESFIKSTLSALTSETTLLEDHLERSFNLVTTLLTTMGELTSITLVTPQFLTPEELKRAIGKSHVIRSLSLLDGDGQVLTSSNPDNMGKRIDLSAFAQASSKMSWKIGEVQFGQVMPYRDLREWALQKESPTQEIMPAIYQVTVEGKPYTWVATVNMSFFHNVWSRIDHNPAVEIAVFNYDGIKVISHHEQAVNASQVFANLSRAISDREIGHFYLEPDQRFLVVYRSSARSSIIVASIANMSVLRKETTQTREFLLLIAAIGSALVIGVLVTLYRMYIRQARAAAISSNLLAGITAHVMMTRSDLNGRIEDVNQPMLEATGYSRDELIGKSHQIFSSGLERPELFENMWQTIAGGEIWRGTFRNRTKSGDILWLTATIIPFRDEWGEITHYISLYSDITQAIRLSQEYEKEKSARLVLESLNQKLRSEATLDPLTGVANRRGLDEFVQQMNNQADLAQMSLAVLMIDIDHFKQINDNWGHAVGDVVLKTLCNTWSGLIRSSDLLVRLGGEEFALILPRTPKKDAMRVAEKLRHQTAALQIESTLLDQPLQVTVSIGVAYADHTAEQSIDVLLSQSDQALYAAKEAGRNRVIGSPEA